MKDRLNTKGMTLVEVILAMAIASIIAVSFLSIFTTGFTLVKRAGNKSTAVFNNHAEIEATLSSPGANTTSEIDLKLSDGTVIKVLGELEVFTQESGKGSTSITIFKPSN